MAFYEPVIRALNEAQVRYVVVGGLAVVLHGYARFTVDLDLAVDLSPPEAAKVIDAMLALDLYPTAPIDPEGFADAATREVWAAAGRPQDIADIKALRAIEQESSDG